MITHQFNCRGLIGNIEYDNTILHFYYTLPDGNVRHFKRINFFEEDLVQEYTNHFVTWLVNSLSEEITPRTDVDYIVDSSMVNAFQNTELSTITAGITYLDYVRRSTINGLISSLVDFECSNVKEGDIFTQDKLGRDGIRPYNIDDMSATQPVVFDMMITNESGEGLDDGSLAITVVDQAVGQIQYSLDEAAYTDLVGDITGIASGEHKIQLKGTDSGLSMVKNFTIEEFVA